MAWAKEVWDHKELHKIMDKAWRRQAPQGQEAWSRGGKTAAWRAVKGPAGATDATAKEVGWDMVSPWVCTTAAGSIDFRELGPVEVKTMAKEAVQKVELGQ